MKTMSDAAESGYTRHTGLETTDDVVQRYLGFLLLGWPVHVVFSQTPLLLGNGHHSSRALGACINSLSCATLFLLHVAQNLKFKISRSSAEARRISKQIRLWIARRVFRSRRHSEYIREGGG